MAEKFKMGDKIMSKKVAKREKKIQKEFSTPKHKYFKMGNLSIHLDKASKSTCTEGRYHAPIYFPKKIRIMWRGKRGWIKCIPLGDKK